MREQLYTVTAKNGEGESFERPGLTHKQATGLMADMRTWGVKDLCMVPEIMPRDLEPDIEEGHRHAVQIAVLFIVTIAVVAVLMYAAVAWAKSQSHAPIVRTAFDFTPFLPK